MMVSADHNQIVTIFAKLVEKHCPRGTSADTIGKEDGHLWAALAQGGWLDIASHAMDGDAMPLTTLALIATEWGRRIPALPFSSSVMARRWFDVATGSSAAHTFAIPDGNQVLIPFGDTVGVFDGAGNLTPVLGKSDNFALTLPVSRADSGVQLSAEQCSELQVLYAGEALGAAEEAFERAASYAQERVAYGKPVSAFQALRHLLANMHLDLELGRSALLWAASVDGADRDAAIGEVTRLAQSVAAHAIQVFGGIGFTWDLGIHLYLRHIIAARELCRPVRTASARRPRVSHLNVGGEAEVFRQNVRAWLARVVPSEWANATTAEEDRAIRRQWVTILHAGGYSGLRWPKAYGGCGLGPVEAAIFYEECARANAPESIDNSPRSVAVTLAGPAIIAHGTDAQKEHHLAKILDGSEIWCEGFSEPGAGSDLAAVSTTAILDGEVFHINGSKIWTSFAQEADYCYLLAKTSTDAPRHRNLSVFLLDMRQSGVKVQPLKNIVGEHEFNQVFFDNAIAHKTDLLGELHEGWKLVTIGAAALRSSGGDGGTSVHWSRYVQMSAWLERLGQSPHIEDAVLGKLRAKLDVLWWTNARTAGVFGEDDGFPPIRGGSNILKIAVSELLQEISALGLEMAQPSDRDFWRQQYLLSRSRTIAGGTSQIQRNVIADQILKLRKA